MPKPQSIESFNNLPFDTKLDWLKNFSTINEVNGYFSEFCIADTLCPVIIDEDGIFSHSSHIKLDIKYDWIKDILITDPYIISIYLTDGRVERFDFWSEFDCLFTGDGPFGTWLVRQIQSCTEDEYIIIGVTPTSYNEERNVICLTTGEEFNPAELEQNPGDEGKIIGPDGFIQYFSKLKKKLIPISISPV